MRRDRGWRAGLCLGCLRLRRTQGGAGLRAVEIVYVLDGHDGPVRHGAHLTAEQHFKESFKLCQVWGVREDVIYCSS